MADQELAGVVVAAGPDGRRSTTALGQAVLAAALRPVDEPGAAAVERATSWRSDYPAHFRRLVEAGLPDPKSWLTVAESGLAELDRQLRLARADGTEDALPAALTEPAGRELDTAEVAGTGEPERELVLPYRGRRLRGDELRRQLDDWVAAGVVEPSLRRGGRRRGRAPRVAAAGRAARWPCSAPGPRWARCRACCAGAPTVAAVDLPRPALWQRLRRTARAGRRPAAGPGRTAGATGGGPAPTCCTRCPGGRLAGRAARSAGARQLRVRRRGRTVRCPAAADALGQRLRQRRDDLALAFLATPTDVFAVPARGGRAGHPPVRPALGRRRAAAPRRCGWSARAGCSAAVPARRRPRDQRQPGPAAGAELRAGQAAAALAGRGRPGRRDAGVAATSPRPPGPARW